MSACPVPISEAPPAIERVLDDVHARLNATRVRVLRPRDVDDAQGLMHACADHDVALAVMGARHAMGGQQLLEARAGCVLDTSGLDRVLAFDDVRGHVTVEAGIRWPALLAWLRAHPGNTRGWTIRQKQTGADDFSLGGALASNIHGRGLAFAPFVEDVESIELLDADGALHTLDRTRHPDWFAHVAGGYGLFGLVVRMTLRLVPRMTVLREVRMARSATVMDDFEDAIARGCTHGDFQFAVDPGSRDFLQRGILSCYRPCDGVPTPSPRHLDADDFARLLLQAHRNPTQAFETYAAFYLASDGQRYESDTMQTGVYLDGYHAAIDACTGHRGSEMITELYVPRGCLADFMRDAAVALRRTDAQPIYGTVRLVERDTTSALPWAREAWACVVFNLHVRHDDDGIAAARIAFRALIDCALAQGGSFYLTYHRWATRAQIDAAHPGFAAFLHAKAARDPRGRWSSEWHRHHARLYGLATR